MLVSGTYVPSQLGRRKQAVWKGTLFSVLEGKPLSVKLQQTQEVLQKGISVSFCTSVLHRFSCCRRKASLYDDVKIIVFTDVSLGMFFLSGDITEVEGVRCCFILF